MIIWLEDRVETIKTQVATIRKRLDIEPLILPTPASVKIYLEEEFANGDGARQAPIFLIDLMLHGIMDLSDIGILNAPTLAGNHTGYVFADRFLLGRESQWKNCNICFVTERDIDEELEDDIDHLRNKNYNEIKIFRKYSDDDFDDLLKTIIQWRSQT